MFKRSVALYKPSDEPAKRIEDIPVGEFFVFDFQFETLLSTGNVSASESIYYKLNDREVICIDDSKFRCIKLSKFECSICRVIPEVELKVLIKGLGPK